MNMDRNVDNTIASCTFVSATFLATYTTDIYLLRNCIAIDEL
jgi:hypothetical protein